LSNAVLIIELKNKTHSGTLTQAYYAKNQGRKIFILKEIVEANEESIGWKTLKREVNPIIVEDPDEIIDEINTSAIFQKKLTEHQLEIKGY
jgi:predicted Rossmann fold nucleotide-binding protein DprA/Smf involved in DNA uptake